MRRIQRIPVIVATAMGFTATAMAQTATFNTTGFVPILRLMIGKSLLDQSIEFNNKYPLVLQQLTPEGARFFLGGRLKDPKENADDMRQTHGLLVLITPCPGVHDLTAKVASVAVWETIADRQRRQDRRQDDSDERISTDSTVGLEQLLSLMNTPPGVVTPSLLRVPRVKDLHGPVFEYVRGDTTEAVSFVNEGTALRIDWSINNNAACPHS